MGENSFSSPIQIQIQNHRLEGVHLSTPDTPLQEISERIGMLLYFFS
jgi:hypothetical protein